MKVALWCPLFPEQEILFTNRLFEFGNLAKRLSHLCQSALFVCWFLCSSCFFSLQKDFRICSKVHYLCADFFVLHASFACKKTFASVPKRLTCVLISSFFMLLLLAIRTCLKKVSSMPLRSLMKKRDAGTRLEWGFSSYYNVILNGHPFIAHSSDQRQKLF